MGSGSIAGMIASLKNNKRKRIRVFKRLELYKDVKLKKGRIDKKASPAVLKQIRDKVKMQQRRENAITYSCIAIGVFFFIWLISK